MFRTMLARIAPIFIFPILVGCGGGGGGLADPGLSNVLVESGSARAAVIGPDGGTITATGSNGVVYTLTVPEGAVLRDTQIAVYPLKGLKNLPAGGTVSAGVNFAPEGLQLRVPATLAMQFPAGVDPSKLAGFTFKGNGLDEHLFPAEVTGQKATMSVAHFSGGGMGGQNLLDLLKDVVTDTTSEDFQARMERAYARAILAQPAGDPGPEYNQLLDDWYKVVVKPALNRGGRPDAVINQAVDAELEYNAWRDALTFAVITSFDANIARDDLIDSKPRAALVLQRDYQLNNEKCGRDADNPPDTSGIDPDSPINDAALALAVGSQATRWDIATQDNHLDLESLLNNLCVKVVIGSRSYSGTKFGDVGTLALNAGIKITDHPVRHDVKVRVKVSGASISSNPSTGLANDQGDFHSTVLWPDGLDPIKIDMLANIESTNSLIKKIAVFDRITKANAGSGGGGGGGGGGGNLFPPPNQTTLPDYASHSNYSGTVSGTCLSGPAQATAIFIQPPNGLPGPVKLQITSTFSGSTVFSGFVNSFSDTSFTLFDQTTGTALQGFTATIQNSGGQIFMTVTIQQVKNGSPCFTRFSGQLL